MEYQNIKEFDFTDAAWESLYGAVDDTDFFDKDAQLIYDLLKHRLKIRSFGDYLKRYIYRKAELNEPFTEVPLKEYQMIIRSSFSDRHTPASFTPTTAKTSALIKNWLTQKTVKRNVVFLLGFGLDMCVEDINRFLTKALRESEINPKDPFEVICWYCYRNHYNYLKYEQLWECYSKLPAKPEFTGGIYDEYTVNIRNTMYAIQDDDSLMSYLARLKVSVSKSRMSLTARMRFDELYNEARDLIARLYNQYEEEQHTVALHAYIKKLAQNDRLYDSEKQERIRRFQACRRVYTRADISESDMEHVICAAIPTDRHGNLTPGRDSGLNELFWGKRFSRQRIGEILSGSQEINRFDLITLSFFVFSQKLDIYPDAKQRFLQFYDATNAILEKCFFGKLYVQNPYECFVLMCTLSEDPLGTYADVWELSYDS